MSGLRHLALLLLCAGAAGQTPTPVRQLVAQAERRNPEVIAALRAWQAAAQAPSQAATLPDPEVTIAHVSAGSPLPFSGFNSVPMSFLGVGISETLPYPGKLRLRGEKAEREAAGMRERWRAARRALAERVRDAYAGLADAQQTLAVLGREQRVLQEIEAIAEARYRVGQGSEQEVLHAQLEETRLLRDEAQAQEQRGQMEARLKQLIERPPQSPDVVAATPVETPLPYTAEQLLGRVRGRDPGIAARQQAVRGGAVGVELARKNFDPDFRLSYQYEKTGTETPDRYSLSLGVSLPIFRNRRQEPALAQAELKLRQARREYEAGVQDAWFEVQDQYLAAQTDAHMLAIYRQGLMPQATATFQAGLTAYQAGREDFETLLRSFLDVLNLDSEYWRTLAHHEIALARLQQLTGIPLP
jgi:cobalt-zinc-cadmium efflux system outer membrane protein